MPKACGLRASDIQGARQLTVDAVIGITDLAEAMHQSILSGGGVLAPSGQTRTRGITGAVYKSIRTITQWAGKGLDLPLGALATLLHDVQSSPRREALLAALNGVLGDYLHASHNPLAVSMRFRRQGKALTDAQLAEIIRHSRVS